jgi:hypothetical protein
MDMYEDYFLNNKNILRFKSLPKVVSECKLKNLDNLFWCFFICLKGEVEFEHLKMLQKIDVTEKQMKISFLEKIELRRKEITKKKLVKTLSTVEDNLRENITTKETLVVLAFIENINLLFVDDKTFFICKNSDKEFNIIKNDKIIHDSLEKCKENKIERYKVNKILAPIANYKVNDLKEIYAKLSLPTEKLTKQKMYDNIESLIKN